MQNHNNTRLSLLQRRRKSETSTLGLSKGNRLLAEGTESHQLQGHQMWGRSAMSSNRPDPNSNRHRDLQTPTSSVWKRVEEDSWNTNRQSSKRQRENRYSYSKNTSRKVQCQLMDGLHHQLITTSTYSNQKKKQQINLYHRQSRKTPSLWLVIYQPNLPIYLSESKDSPKSGSISSQIISNRKIPLSDALSS